MERHLERHNTRTYVFWDFKAAKTANFQALSFWILPSSDPFCLFSFTWSTSCVPDRKQLQGRTVYPIQPLDSQHLNPRPVCSVPHARWLSEHRRTWLKCGIKLHHMGPWMQGLVSVVAKTKIPIESFLERVYSYLSVKWIFLEEM